MRRATRANHKNRGGQKKGKQEPKQSQQKRGTTTGGAGQRSDADKRYDQVSNPDDAGRRPTDEQR